MLLICHVTLQYQLILAGISSKYATTLVSLVNIGIMMVSMMVSFDRHYIWPHVKTFKRLLEFVGGIHSRSVKDHSI